MINKKRLLFIITASFCLGLVTICDTLPPDERPTYKHNTHYIVIELKEDARIENSGDLFL